MDIARELVQETFTMLWEKRESIDLSRSVKSYLMTSLHNRCLNYLRDNKKFDKDLLAAEYLQPESLGEDALQSYMTQELNNRIQEAISLLPDRCRQVFTLSRFENLKYQEIAEQLSISVKTVEVQMSKALQILREKLSDYLPAILALIVLLKSN